MLRIGTVAPAPLWYLSSFLVELLPGKLFSHKMLEELALIGHLYDKSFDIGITTRPVPELVSQEMMRENIYVSAPVGHPFAKRDTLSFTELGAESFILYEHIGFWMQVHKRLMPNAQFFLQSDRQVFLQLMATTHTLGFVSDAPSAYPKTSDIAEVVLRSSIPLLDPEAHATFYLVAREDTLQTNDLVKTLMDRVPGSPDQAGKTT